LKKYQIPESSVAAVRASGAPVPKVSPVVPVVTFNEIEDPVMMEAKQEYDDSTQALIQEEPVLPPRPAVRVASSEPPGTMLLPNPEFDGETSDWRVVECKLSKLTLKGVQLQKDGRVAQLGWKKIQTISVARIRIIDHASPSGQTSFLILDMILRDPQLQGTIIYRLQSEEAALKKIFPGVDQTFEEAFQNFVGILIKNSGARCLPNEDSCRGPNFATYPELSRYEVRLKEKL
jgi:hypothetical protein